MKSDPGDRDWLHEWSSHLLIAYTPVVHQEASALTNTSTIRTALGII